MSAQGPSAPARAAAEDFLFLEAALLSDARYKEWLELFAPEGEYWVPATVGQRGALDEVSHVYEDHLLREIRVERYASPVAFSLQPMPRATHMVSNVRVGEYDESLTAWVVRSRFSVVQFHRGTRTLFAGEYVHWLRCVTEGFRIRRKRVNLVDCEGAFGDIVIYL